MAINKKELEVMVQRMESIPYKSGHRFDPLKFKNTRTDEEGRALRLEHMIRMYEEGVSIAQIGRVYRISRQHAADLLKPYKQAKLKK